MSSFSLNWVHVLSCLLGHPFPSYFNDVIYERPFGRGEGLECMQTAWYVLDIKMSDSLFPSSLSTPHCSAGVNRGISNSLGRNSCFITETVGGTVYRLDIRWLLFKFYIHLFPDILVLGKKHVIYAKFALVGVLMNQLTRNSPTNTYIG